MNKWFDNLRMLSNHSYFVSGMVFLWLYLEYCLAFWIEKKETSPYLVIWVTVFFTFFLLKLAVVNHFKVSPLTIRKMMTNALGFKWLSLLFVLTFAMQLAWFVDAAYKLFVEGNNDIKIICQCGLTFFSLLVVNILFPIGERKSKTLSSDNRKLLISGLSVSKVYGKNDEFSITKNNIDLLLKPMHEYLIEKVVIIRSNTLLKSDFADDVDDSYIDKKSKEEYNNKHSDSSFVDCIKKIISKRLGKEVNVILSDPVNYDDFDTVFEETSKQLRVHENNTLETVVFITPGSATVTSALTPLAIRGKRLLVFAAQGEKGMPLRESQIDVLTVEDLLSELWGEYEVKS